MSKMIDFHCPNCGADLSDDALAAAHDWSEGIPPTCGAFCDDCGRDVWFRLEWASPTLKKAAPLEAGAAGARSMRSLNYQ